VRWSSRGWGESHEERSELLGEERPVVVQLAPGDAQDAVALCDEVAVARAVVLEGPCGVVGLAAVEF
jgi:hypothetical protein